MKLVLMILTTGFLAIEPAVAQYDSPSSGKQSNTYRRGGLDPSASPAPSTPRTPTMTQDDFARNSSSGTAPSPPPNGSLERPPPGPPLRYVPPQRVPGR